MNVKKLLMASAAVWLVGSLYTWLTCGWLFSWIYELPPTSLWKSNEEMMSGTNMIGSGLAGILAAFLFVLVFALIKKGIPKKDAADIFSLSVKNMEPLERFAQKKAQNVTEAIQKAKNISLDRFLFALGIRHVGEEIARLLAGQLTRAGFFKSKEKNWVRVSLIKKTFSQLSSQKLTAIGGAGEKISRSIQEYFKNPKNQELLEKLNQAKLKINLPKISKKPLGLLGKTFVITGTLPELSREEAKEEIITRGGKVADSVSSETDYLLLGKNPGSKLEKARELGIKKIGEKELKKMLG